MTHKKLLEMIRSIHKDTLSGFHLCSKMIEKIEKEMEEKEFPKDRKRIQTLILDYEIWIVMKDLAEEKLKEMKELLELAESVLIE